VDGPVPTAATGRRVGRAPALPDLGGSIERRQNTTALGRLSAVRCMGNVWIAPTPRAANRERLAERQPQRHEGAKYR